MHHTVRLGGIEKKKEKEFKKKKRNKRRKRKEKKRKESKGTPTGPKRGENNLRPLLYFRLSIDHIIYNIKDLR